MKLPLSFDPCKDASNLRKHGVSLGTARWLVWEEALSWEDKRKEYGEMRMCALLPLDDRLYFVAYVDRPASAPAERRIISLRKANAREVLRYATDYQEPHGQSASTPPCC